MAVVSDAFPNFLWDCLLPQTELTLNLLRQSNIATSISAWEHYNGPFNFNGTPMGPMGFPIIIQNKPTTHRYWEFRSHKGFNIGPTLNHYC